MELENVYKIIYNNHDKIKDREEFIDLFNQNNNLYNKLNDIYNNEQISQSATLSIYLCLMNYIKELTIDENAS